MVLETAHKSDDYSWQPVMEFQRRRHSSMKRNACLIAVLVALACGVTTGLMVGAENGSEKHAFTPDALPYGPAPAFVPAGAQLAVLEGDPSASSGDYTIRL